MSESRPKKCGHCAAPTTLHLTKVVNGKVYKLGVCANCPEAAAIQSGVGWDLLDTPAVAPVSNPSQSGSRKCPDCGLTPADFKEYGRLGCPTCYEVFQEKLEPLLKTLHRGVTHLGKAPRGRRRSISPEEIEALKRRMDEHVSREEYELAAVVRDQLKSLEESS
ncbi:UvrB/UvrC motif-containing protein [Pelagicoccus sp. SDUM812003]|uniref:UvrB/UvrC motif-containing protein n=1 Tax=Pelagicoccus sp. SDUM812003 TaxID=3041267 RepID=UPI00280D7A70|nr:UvrB/UvrC motif-containing protein [Pelagicoccus sp. SDUM812003]MDQ8201518.1 UvrB/UvrC motif-containing protein [Pelagicoccus sp. SDUM812003]